MWREPFLNFCFVLLLITALALQHAVAQFGRNVRDETVPDIEMSHSGPLWLGGNFLSRWQLPSPVTRAAAFFDDAWHRSMAVEEWWLDYTASQWELANASTPAERDLMEARFHVANAEVFTSAMSKNGRAIKELAWAETWVHAARANAGPKLNAQMSTVSDEITTAEAHEQTEDGFSNDRLEAIKTDLDHLIALLRFSTT